MSEHAPSLPKRLVAAFLLSLAAIAIARSAGPSQGRRGDLPIDLRGPPRRPGRRPLPARGPLRDHAARLGAALLLFGLEPLRAVPRADGNLPKPWRVVASASEFRARGSSVGFRSPASRGLTAVAVAAAIRRRGRFCPGFFDVLHNDRIGRLRVPTSHAAGTPPSRAQTAPPEAPGQQQATRRARAAAAPPCARLHAAGRCSIVVRQPPRRNRTIPSAQDNPYTPPALHHLHNFH